MAKRFTDTGKWDKEWYMNLPPRLKCFWNYINDKCDQAGMWEANFKLASIYIGETVSEVDLKFFGPRVEKYGEGKVWIVDHIDFQSGGLSERSPAHKPIFKLLIKYSLLDRVLNRVYNTLQEKEMEIEKEEEKEMEKKGVQGETKLDPGPIHVGRRNEHSVMILSKYLGQRPVIIHDLQEHFQRQGQLEQIQRAGWIDFTGFMAANPAAVFDDDKHLYNSFRSYSTKKHAAAINNNPFGKNRKQEHTIKLAASVAETYRNVAAVGPNG